MLPMGMGLFVSVVFTGLADFANHDAFSYLIVMERWWVPLTVNLFRGLLFGWYLFACFVWLFLG